MGLGHKTHQEPEKAAQCTKSLLAMKGAYNTVSTNCLPVIAGTMPLDLEVRLPALKRALARQKISPEVMAESETELYTEWPTRYDTLHKEVGRRR